MIYVVVPINLFSVLFWIIPLYEYEPRSLSPCFTSAPHTSIPAPFLNISPLPWSSLHPIIYDLSTKHAWLAAYTEFYVYRLLEIVLRKITKKCVPSILLYISMMFPFIVQCITKSSPRWLKCCYNVKTYLLS